MLALAVLVMAGCGAEANQRPASGDENRTERISPPASETPTKAYGY